MVVMASRKVTRSVYVILQPAQVATHAFGGIAYMTCIADGTTRVSPLGMKFRIPLRCSKAQLCKNTLTYFILLRHASEKCSPAYETNGIAGTCWVYIRRNQLIATV